MWQNIWPNSETLLVYLHMSPFSNKWLNGRLKREKVARSIISFVRIITSHIFLVFVSIWEGSVQRRISYSSLYRGPGKKLDRDSNAGNCKYYVFEKSITLLTNNGTFRNSCLQSWTSKQSGFLFCGTCFTKYSLYRPAKS